MKLNIRRVDITILGAVLVGFPMDITMAIKPVS
jgi:hypothetical protein